MPSFDIVSKVDDQEIDNAVNNTIKEISTRFDFKGGKSSVELDKVAKKIKILADDDLKLRAIHQILELKLLKRGIDITCLNYGKEEEAGGKQLRQVVDIKTGIDKESAKKITKLIKDSKLKVQAQIQDEQVRVTGKQIDDLQAVQAQLKTANIGLALQFVNMRSN
jgi:cyclic-di-GMP-binding protein